MKAYRIAIVGLGPKGLYAFERLLAQLGKIEGEQEIEVHLFEKSGNYGAGAIYDPNQPNYLLMNYPNRNIDVWPTENLKPVVEHSPSFSEWLTNRTPEKVASYDDQFASRSLVGKYLKDSFENLYKRGIQSYRIIKHSCAVVDISKMEEAYKMRLKVAMDGEDQTLIVNNILISTGHCSWKGSFEERKHGDGTKIPEKSTVPFIYPVNLKLSKVQGNTPVAIKGMCLTFIDAVLALTEGRGGRFLTKNDDLVVYEPSYKEPSIIYAFSRTGLPMVPRSVDEGKKAYRPVYFTHDSIRRSMGNGQKPCFLKHILPLYKLETEYRYYTVAFKNKGLTLYPEDNANGLRRQILDFHKDYTEEYPFRFENMFRSVDIQNPSVKLGPLAYLRYLVEEAELGSEKSPFMAAAMTWGKISGLFRGVYNFGGMTAESHQMFDQNFRSQLNRISYGPPLTNMKKIVALVESGILNLDYAKKPNLLWKQNRWHLGVKNRKPVEAEMLVDARIPTNVSQADWSPLLKGMQKNELLREFIVPGKKSYNTSCPEIDRSGRLVDPEGNINNDITLYGTLTEGIVYDNDSLSRECNNFASSWALRTVEKFSEIQLNSKIEAP